MIKVSVIIPVYGVEDYIERCARSLFEQTLQDIEFIFVNDCTKDKSIAVLQRVLEEYPFRKSQTVILNHEKNEGVAAARTTGMKAMKGEYMIHCDPDDWVEREAYELMYNKAVETGADIITCKYWEEYGKNRSLNGIYYVGEALISLKHSMYTGKLWDKLIKSSFIIEFNIYPYYGVNYTEDLNVVIRVLSYARSVNGLEQPLYHYDVSRDTSICKSDYYNNLTKHQIPSIEKLEEFIERRYYETNNPIFNSRLLNIQKFWSKWGLYSSHNFDLWCKIWPECHCEIMHFKSIDLRFRIFLRLFCNRPKILSLIYKWKPCK